jgi:hypothetical protein
MEGLKINETIIDVYNRTMNNCKTYMLNDNTSSLLNEIGVLRGVAYCMEISGIPYPNFTEFQKMIDIQQNLKHYYANIEKKA